MLGSRLRNGMAAWLSARNNKAISSVIMQSASSVTSRRNGTLSLAAALCADAPTSNFTTSVLGSLACTARCRGSWPLCQYIPGEITQTQAEQGTGLVNSRAHTYSVWLHQEGIRTELLHQLPHRLQVRPAARSSQERISLLHVTQNTPSTMPTATPHAPADTGSVDD